MTGARLIASVHVTLDGVMGDPEEWSYDALDDEAARLAADELDGASALLMGRVTYEEFAEYWPSATGALADRMNGLPKHVVSSTLAESRWQNSTLIRGDIAHAVAELKRRAGDYVLLLASADLANLLTAHGLIDEYRLFTHPVVRGRGKRYFAGAARPTPLELARAEPVGRGGVLLCYRGDRHRA